MKAEEAEVHGFEDSGVFEGCMPVEVMARRGEDTLRFGPLKPRGLVDPKTGREPYAVVQLRRDTVSYTHLSTPSPNMAPTFLRPVSMRSAPSVTTTWVLSDFTLEVMEPAPMWDL